MKKITAALCFVSLVIAQTASAQLVKTSKRDMRVVVTNAGSKPLQHLYAMRAGNNAWQEDILGDSVVPPHQHVTINFDDGSDLCMLDIKGVWSDDSTAQKAAFDVCANASLTLKN